MPAWSLSLLTRHVHTVLRYQNVTRSEYRAGYENIPKYIRHQRNNK